MTDQNESSVVQSYTPKLHNPMLHTAVPMLHTAVPMLHTEMTNVTQSSGQSCTYSRPKLHTEPKLHTGPGNR